MDYEPTHQSAARPCALPHTAPLGWLRAAGPEPADAEDEPLSPEEQRRALIRHHMDELERLAAEAEDGGARGTGWTPFARKLFLSTLAETGRVNLACQYADLSKQSAYALRARDPVFAAGWDAAAELARDALADALMERALDGATETIRRNGEVIAERHRFDARLSMAVLARLDARCDRTASSRIGHGNAKADWDRFLAAVGDGDDRAAADILIPPPVQEKPNPGQASQADADPLDGKDVWWDEERAQWLTAFPHPDGDETTFIRFVGRPCTPEEAALLDAADTLRRAQWDHAELGERQAWFDALRAFVERGTSDEAEDGGESAVSAKEDGGAAADLAPETGS